MNFNRFLPDYGVLPSAYFKRSAISNPIELFWSDDLCSLLRLCGTNEEMIGERASDYDRFLSLCRSLPLLEGHPTRAWIASVFEKYFDLKEPPNEEDAPEIWKTLCRRLLDSPIAPQDLVVGSWLCDSLTVPNDLPENMTPVLNANLFLHTTAKNAMAWSGEIAATVSHFAKNGCQKVVVQLQDDFLFVLPSIYQVDRALSLTKRDHEATNLLICQLIRELCKGTQEHDLMLVLICKSNAADACKLLNYCETSVGLPRVCWSVREAREAYALLEFTAKVHKNDFFAALPYENVMTQGELSQTIESWQMRYPIGRLCFLTARDLRQMPYAQEHIADMLLKSKTKS